VLFATGCGAEVVVEAGKSPEDVVRVLGFTRTVNYDWLAKYREGGIDALRAKTIPGPHLVRRKTALAVQVQVCPVSGYGQGAGS